MILASFAKTQPLPIMLAGFLPQFRKIHIFTYSLKSVTNAGQNDEEEDLSNLAARKNFFPAPYGNSGHLGMKI